MPNNSATSTNIIYREELFFFIYTELIFKIFFNPKPETRNSQPETFNIPSSPTYKNHFPRNDNLDRTQSNTYFQYWYLKYW